MYYNRDGKQITLSEWGNLSTDANYKHVGYTEVVDTGKPKSTRKRYRVSTVWLGLDHSFSQGGTILIFESMAFVGDSFNEDHCERYSTLEQARLGHERMVLMVGESMVKPEAKDIPRD